jgi:hypothetical protein
MSARLVLGWVTGILLTAGIPASMLMNGPLDTRMPIWAYVFVVAGMAGLIAFSRLPKQ